VSEYLQFDGSNRPVSTDTTTKFQQITSNEARRTVQVRANEGALRLIVGGNADTWREVENLKADRFQAATDLKAGEGVAGSARGALMSPIAAADLRHDSLVTLPNGYQTTAAAAARLGYLSRNPAGGYTNTQPGAPAPQQAPQPQPRVAPIDTHTALEEDYAGSAAVFKHGVSPSLTARAVEEMATSGQMSPDVLREASQQLDADPSMVASVMRKAMDGYGRQFEAHAVKAGVVPQHFTQWAQSQRGDALKIAMVRHVTQQDPRAYNALLAEFRQSRR
jgi:hypothetical protein